VYYITSTKPSPKGAGRQKILTRKNLPVGQIYPAIGVYFELPILNIPVPHVGHLPFIAGLPFFKVTATAAGSSFFARHFTQYIVAIVVIHLPSNVSLYKRYYFNIFAKKNSNTINSATIIIVLISSFRIAWDSVSSIKTGADFGKFGVTTGKVNTSCEMGEGTEIEVLSRCWSFLLYSAMSLAFLVFFGIGV